MKRVYVPLCALIVLLHGAVFGAGGVLPGDGLTAATAFQIQDLDDFRAFADPANAATYWASGVHVELTCHLNLTGESYTTAVIAPDTDSGSVNWQGTPYQGIFHGNGFEISNMTINDQDDCNNNVGLFGRIEGGTVENLGVVNCAINVGDENGTVNRSTGYVGGLCGNFDNGTVSNCYATGSIQASAHSNDMSTSGTESIFSIGGLCGSFFGTMSHCYSTCTVNASASDYYVVQLGTMGGLCGYSDGAISNSYATGSVTAEISRFSGGYTYSGYYLNEVAGLCGKNYGTINNCYASSPVQCTSNNESLTDVKNIGGLVGYNNGTVINSYAVGSVSASAVGDSRAAYCHWVGGLAGNNQATIDKCYSTGAISVSASSNSYANLYANGGLCGVLGDYDIITNSFWDTETSQMATSAGGIGKTTTEMQTESTFTAAGWDFDDSDGSADWTMGGYPQLFWQPVYAVDFKELATLAQYWQMTGCVEGQPCAAADWYVDETIDVYDLRQLALSWLESEIILSGE